MPDTSSSCGRNRPAHPTRADRHGRFAAWLLAACMLGTLLAPVPVNAQPLPAGVERTATVEGITEYQLTNGLRLLTLPDPSVDTITVNVTYLVGSRHEGYGEAGMAHLLEHLLFRGTPRHPNVKGDFQRRGARFNGTTSYDRTNYFATYPATGDNLEWALAMEADRMVNANVSQADLDAEMTVVRNEFESGENSPAGLLRSRVAAAAYQWHNYGRAIIGTRSDIERMPIERLRAFYRTWYRPDNAVLVVAGRIDPVEVVRLTERHFGPLERPAAPLPVTYTVEPPQDGERSVVLRRVGEVQMVSAQYHLPAGAHPDYAAVDVLVAILGQTPGGRLHKALVETGLATSVFGTERQKHDPGSAYFGASVRAGQAIEPVRDVLIDTIEGLARNPPTDEEVELVKTRMLNEIEMLLANSRSLAIVLSEAIAIGDWRLLFLHRDRLRQVKTEDVRRVAAAYLRSANRTVGMFLPGGEAQRVEIPAAPDVAGMVRDYRGDPGAAARLAAGESFEPTPENIETRVIRRELPGGMRLALLPRKTRGSRVVAQLALRWGNESDKHGQATACGIASSMLLRGTETRTREQIRNEFARLKASAGIGGEGASLETVREHLAEALRLTAEVLRRPAFPASEFEQLRRAALASIEAQKHDPRALAGLALSRHINPRPPEHWNYVATLEERIRRLERLTLDEVRTCHRRFYGASDSELAVVGDFDPEEITRLASELFGDWKSPVKYARIPSSTAPAEPLRLTIRTPDKANAVLRGALSIALRDDDPDYPALLLANWLLGGSSDARLPRRIRETEGLSYSTGTFFTASSRDRRADFGVYSIYAPQNRDRVETALMEELRHALEAGFSEQEVSAGRIGLLQSRQLSRSRDETIAERLLTGLELGRTFAWDAELDRRITALTVAEVNAALRRHVDPARLSLVAAGDFPASPGPPVASRAAGATP